MKVMHRHTDAALDSAVDHSLGVALFFFLYVFELKYEYIPKNTSGIFPKNTSGDLPDTS